MKKQKILPRRQAGKIKSIFYSPKFMTLIGFVVLVLICTPLAKNISKRYIIDKEISDLEQEIEDLESKNKDFKNLIGYLESDQFVEEQARLKLGLKKPGEEVIVLKEDPNASSTIVSAEEVDTSLTNPQKWWNYFFN